MNKPFSKPKFDTSNNKKYKVEIIRDSAIYTKEIEQYLPGLILSDFLKKLPRRRKYLGILFCSHIFLENNLHILQKSLKKTNGNLFFSQFCSVYGQAISQVLY